jgi:integrase
MTVVEAAHRGNGLEGLEEVADGVIVRPMLTIDDAIDLWLGHLARIGRATRTRDSYSRYLDKFCDRFPRGWDVAQVTPEECEAFLDQWAHRKPATRHAAYAPLSGMFKWLYRTRKIKTNPMEFVEPPVRQRPEDIDVVSVAPADVRRLLAFCSSWSERLAVAIPAYLGPRRSAAALLRLTDYDQDQQLIRFREKGGKTIWKPVPDELAAMLRGAIADGAILYPDGYLIPGEAATRNGERDSRVVWRLVKKVAKRAGVEVHVHALRAAFACFYLETHPGDVEALQTLMGHRSMDTTKVYLRKLDRRVAKERVRDLSWGNVDTSIRPQIADEPFESFPDTEKEGFEPSFSEQQPSKRPGTEPVAPEGSETPGLSPAEGAV